MRQDREFGGDRAQLETGFGVEPDIATMGCTVTLPEPAAPSEPEDRRTVRVRLNSMSGNVRIERAA